MRELTLDMKTAEQSVILLAARMVALMVERKVVELDFELVVLMADLMVFWLVERLAVGSV